MTRHLALIQPEPDFGDFSDWAAYEADQTRKTPAELAKTQADEARAYMDRLRASQGLRLPWPDVDRMVGPLLPGWLVAIGGRAKSGKTTWLLHLLTAWVELGRRVVYIGTETQVSLLRLVWAAVRCQVPLDVAVDPACPADTYARLMDDVELTQTEPALSECAVFADAPAATVTAVADWVRYGADHGADAVIFDHLSRLEVGPGERWQQLGDAIRQIKTMAVQANLTLVVGAQLTQGQGGSVLGEHEVPGNGSWAGSSNVQREVDVGLQIWRPFQPGITNTQKQAAREDMAKVSELVQPNIMAVRLAAHRWGREPNTFCKLVVERGQLLSHSARTP